jgi:hypothetical protein
LNDIEEKRCRESSGARSSARRGEPETASSAAPGAGPLRGIVRCLPPGPCPETAIARTGTGAMAAIEKFLLFVAAHRRSIA